jgi:PRC-barrel domain
MQQTFASRLRYLDADDLDDSDLDFDGLDVRSHDDQKLGEVDGFLVDSGSGRVLYTVVDSGGWFTSRRFLLPIGHATLDRDRSAIRADISRDRLRQYPEFDERSFSGLSDEDLRSYEARMGSVCCPEDVAADQATWRHDSARHYQQPTWWAASAYTASRLRPIEPSSFRSRHATSTETPTTVPSDVLARERFDREHVTAHGDQARDHRSGDDVSPHFAGRAQPGDVLGLETGGETTGLGDTAEDEDKRRRDAERTRRD